MKNDLLYIYNIIATLIIGITFLSLATDGWSAYTSEAARKNDVERKPVTIPDIGLLDANGNSYKISDYKGKYVVVDMIYTGCEHVCSALGMYFKHIQAQILRDNYDNEVKLLSISFDYVHDDIEQLSAYADRFNAISDIWSITRTRTINELNRLKDLLKVIVLPYRNEYIHNAAIYLISPQGKLIKIIDVNEYKEVIDYIHKHKST